MKRTDKSGQLAESITWMVATVIVIVILVLAIFITQFYVGSERKILSGGKTDLPAKESLFAYLQTKNTDGKLIYDGFGKEGFDDKELSDKIFKGFYEKDYQIINLDSKESDGCFGFGGGIYQTIDVKLQILEEISLGENKCIYLYLGGTNE